MMKVSVLAVLAVLAVSALADNTFDGFVSKYNKPYTKGSEEYNRRLSIYNANVRQMKIDSAQLLAKNVEPWFGVNQYTDMTAAEFKSSGRVMTPRTVDARSCLANGVTMDRSKLVYDIPASWDWRTKNVVSPVQNQGQCGSCWTFSTIASIETAWAIQSGNLTKLSEQEIVDCSTGCVLEDGQQVCNQGCDGGWPWSALTDIISWGGEELESVYPYTAVDGTCARTAANTMLPISNYTCLSGPGLANETDMAAFLVANGVLSIAMDATLLQSYTKGIIRPNFLHHLGCSKVQLDHAINIVGYGTDAQLKVDYWIVRNSWGESWGEAGYFQIERGIGACGLNAGVVFPIVV